MSRFSRHILVNFKYLNFYVKIKVKFYNRNTMNDHDRIAQSNFPVWNLTLKDKTLYIIMNVEYTTPNLDS